MKKNIPANKSAERNLLKTNLAKTDSRWVDQFFALFNQTMANK
jgi:hypothetical protein